jgi:predicted Zn-dependent peptidase
MGYVEMFSSYEWHIKYLDNLAKVTPQDIQRVAQKYFQPASRIIGTYIPKGNEA